MNIPAGLTDRYQDPILARLSSGDTNAGTASPTQTIPPSSSGDQVRAMARKMQQGLLTEQKLDDDFYIGRYRVHDILGQGGMSTVYLAEHTGMQRQVAIKVLLPHLAADSRFVERFYQEARVAASLDHPNIVNVHDVAGEGDLHYLIMEYVRGETLRKLVPDDGLPIAEAVNYLAQASAALAHAHHHDIVHRDIKPDNLVREPSGAVKILDLGLARLAESEDRMLTIHDNMLGTVDYMAPEQAEDSHQVDARADIYSLGCTLYYLLAGHPPFPNGTAAQRLMFHMMKQPKPIRELRQDVPEDVAAVLDRCLAKAPEDRYASCDELAIALQQCLQPNADEPPGTVDLADSEEPTREPAPEPKPTPAPASNEPVADIRVTVRKLLSYRSGIAPESLAKSIEAKLQNNARVADMLERINKVTSQPLKAPAVDDKQIEPSDVADYLDDVLARDKRLPYERHCVSNDAYLAELADCHQALATYLKTPPKLQVSPEARQRILDLPAEAEKVDKLVAGLEDGDAFVRQLAAESLGKLGPSAEKAVEALLLKVTDSDKRVRDAARQALRQIRPV